MIKATSGNELHRDSENGDLIAIVVHIRLKKAEYSSEAPPLLEMMYTATGKDRRNIVRYCRDIDNVMKKLLLAAWKKYTSFSSGPRPWTPTTISHALATFSPALTRQTALRGPNFAWYTAQTHSENGSRSARAHSQQLRNSIRSRWPCCSCLMVCK